MMGPSNDPGIIPRTINKIFDYVQQKQDTLFAIQCSYVELYLDNFIDLLDVETTNSKKKTNAKSKPTKIEIHEDSKTKQVFLSGSDSLKTPVTSVDETRELIMRGSKNRTFGSTQMNSNSSRSHTILTFHIESKKNSDSTSPVRMGKLHLVDLAGSERVSKSGLSNGKQNLFLSNSQQIFSIIL